MKKTLMIATLFCATLLRANIPCFACSDQFMVTTGSFAAAYGKSMEICVDKGYQYFVFRNFSMTGPDGLTLKMQGPQGLNADLFSDSIEETVPNFPEMKVEYEIYCFHEKPELAVVAMDVEAFQALIKSFQQPIEKVEGTRVIDVSTVEEIDEHFAKSDLPVFVDFYSESCPPCRMLAPQYDQFSKDLEGKGIFLKVNVSEAQELREKYEIRSIPTLLIFDAGKVADQAVGLPSILEILNSL